MAVDAETQVTRMNLSIEYWCRLQFQNRRKAEKNIGESTDFDAVRFNRR